jgi:hypothetical protein
MSSRVAPVSIEANKAIVRSFIDAWNSRDFERFGELMGDGAVLHIAGGVVPCDPSGGQGRFRTGASICSR